MKAGNLAAFILGAAVGSAVTWKCVKNKYERIAQEEIDSVKRVFSKRNNSDDKKSRNNKDDILEYENELQKNRYKCEEGKTVNKPVVISPDEFGENEDYDTFSLTYYADKVLTDDGDSIMDDIENTVGGEALESFGEYEDDSVFVKNDNLKCYYEILLDTRKYSDIMTDRRKTGWT